MKIETVQIKGEILEHNGKVLVSDLEDVDLAVGHTILDIINSLGIHAPHIASTSPRYKTTKAVKDFLSRKPEDQLAYGVFDTPKDFLKELIKNMGEKTEGDEVKPKALLPMIYLSRDPSLGFSDTDKDQANVHQLSDGDGNIMGDVDAYWPIISYSLTIVSWHKESTSMLTSHLLTDFRSQARKGVRSYTSETHLGGQPFEFSWSFQDGLTYAGSNISEPFGEGRLNAMTIDLSIKALMYKLRCAKSYEVTFTGRSSYEDTE
ncbi:hypothetical protein [Vibrio europaeus]|uniref:hypothetical protein n=1 Tax=Vibrio europaeus TaxID=300876 RepID=UPI00233EE71E|nr:hypothetical protein [Vibrio europaeus]MDC5753605.1 hypothetical protein [Vibrio europaeus]MDC5816482.1 hypothetical protein [Vibrio europaeus]